MNYNQVIISVPFTKRHALTVAKYMAANQVIMHAQEGLSFWLMDIWDAAVVHSDCIFSHPLQCPGHKNIMWCLVSICLHLCSSRQQDAWEPPSCVAVAVLLTNSLIQKWDVQAPIIVYTCSVLEHAMSSQPVYKLGSCFIADQAWLLEGYNRVLLSLFPLESHGQ